VFSPSVSKGKMGNGLPTQARFTEAEPPSASKTLFPISGHVGFFPHAGELEQPALLQGVAALAKSAIQMQTI